jgi:hypothetical protein
MNNIKTNLIKNSLKLMQDNRSHVFCAVTIRPYEDFLRRFSYFNRIQITEEIIQNLITKYDAHLIPYPNKPKNQYLKIISHNAIETKTKFGSPDIPHSHGIWGIHKTLIQKWNSPSFHNRILEQGSFIHENQKCPLNKVILPIKRQSFTPNLVEKTTPEGWLDYAYKWSGDSDQTAVWSFVQSPNDYQQKTKKEMWDEPHTTNTGLYSRLRREDALPQRPLSTPFRTSQTGTYR